MPTDRQHLAKVKRAAEATRVATERRDAAIVEASEAGVTRRKVAEAAGIHFSRVQQIVAAHRDS